MRTESRGSAAEAPEIGTVIPGMLAEERPYGYMVTLGSWRALWHISDVQRVGQAAARGLIGRTASFKVLKADPAGHRISVTLVEWLDNAANISCNPGRSAAHSAVGGGLIGRQRSYGDRIAASLDNGAAEINSIGARWKNASGPQRAGWVNEQVHTAEFNVDASFKGADLRAIRLESRAPKSVDIVVKDRAGNVVQEVSAKVYSSAKGTARAQRGYGKQARVVPSDQLDGVRAHAGKQAAREGAKGEHRAGPAREHAEVRDLTADRVVVDRVSSRPQTRQQAREMGEKARRQEVAPSDIAGDLGSRARDGAVRGAQSGAAIGSAIETVSAALEAVRSVRNGERSVLEASFDVGVRAGAGAVEGGFKGAVSGSVTATAQVIATRTSSAAMQGLLRSNAPAAAAIVACDVAYSAIKLSTGIIDREAFAAEASRAVKSGAAGYVGAALGGAIGGPAGAFVGGITGNLVADQAARHGVWDRVARMLEDSTATGHSASETYHLEEVTRVADLLRDTGAVAVFDRVFTAPHGGHVSVGAAIVVGRRVLAIDVRAWRGRMSFGDTIEQRAVESGWLFMRSTSIETTTHSEADTGQVVQTKTLRNGAFESKCHRNPALRLGAGTRSMKRWLSNRDSRWRSVHFEPLVVFSAEDAFYSATMQANGRFATLAELRATLHGCPNADPWLADELATAPTWDVVTDREGNVYQGLICERHVLVTLDGGPIEVPWTSIFKLEVRPGGKLSRSDPVAIRMRNGESVCGHIGRESLSLSRMGHLRTLRLADVAQACPASTYFSLDLAGPA